MAVEIPFYQHVSLSHMSNLISGCTVIRKDVVFQVSPDLHDACIRTDLSFWILRARVHRVPRAAYDPWWAPLNQDHRDCHLRGASLTPFAQFSRLGYRSLQSPFKDTIRDQSPGGGLCRQIIGYRIVCTRDVVQVQDLKVLFQLLMVEQVGDQLGGCCSNIPPLLA
jgi:hypothetical protein